MLQWVAKDIRLCMLQWVANEWKMPLLAHDLFLLVLSGCSINILQVEAV